MNSCCKVVNFENPMFYDETNCRFGHYATCPKCSRLHGEARIIYTAPKGLRDAWTVHSEVAAKEFYARSGRPLRFVMSKHGLMPLGFVPAVETAEVEEQF